MMPFSRSRPLTAREALDQIPDGVERLIEADQLAEVGERHLPHEILILGRPERIGSQPFEHAGEQGGGIGRCGRLPSPALIVRGWPSAPAAANLRCCSAPALSAARSCRWRTIVGSSSVRAASPRMHAPGERAQLVGGRLDRIDAEKRRDLRAAFLAPCAISEPIGRATGGSCRRHQQHLDADMRPQAAPGVEYARIEQIGREELVFVVASRVRRRVQIRRLSARRARVSDRRCARFLALLRLMESGIATLKSMSSEKRLIRPQPFDSDVPPPKAGTAPS